MNKTNAPASAKRATNAPTSAPTPINPAAAAARTTPAPAPAPAKDTNQVAVIKTTLGEMVLEFWPDVAPHTVENFIKLANQHFYDGTAFHRIVKGFMIQGGDPLSKSNDPNVGSGGPGYTIKAEFNNRPHLRGVISMARTPDPDSAGCQFFICLAPAPNLDGQYTCFGRLVKGDEVLGKLGDVPVTDNGHGEVSRPINRVGVESIRIVPLDSLK